MDNKVAIVGLGKMGAAIARMMSKSGYEVSGYDPVSVRLSAKITVAPSLEGLLEGGEPLIIAVKPNQVQEVMSKVPDDRLVISIAAGVTLHQLHTARRVPGPVIRVMPNQPLVIKEGVSVLYADSQVSQDQRDFALAIFEAGGDAFYIDHEKDMHTVTALSGSGPAFVELFMQTLEDAGVLMGLSRDVARRLSTGTVQGTGRMVQKSGHAPQEHIHDVTSPGGTTIVGLKTLKDFGMERALIRAVERSVQRSIELGNPEK